jgi:hypothetical protein
MKVPPRSLPAVGLLALLLGACTFNLPSLPDLNPFSDNIPPPACPRVAVLKDADKLTRFAPGPGRDLTDIMLQAEIVSFVGSCVHEGDAPNYTSVNMTIRVGVEITRGPANRDRNVDLKYFVRIPQFYPRPEGNSVMTIKTAFPQNRDTIQYADEPIDLTIPLHGKQVGRDYEVFLGFVLTPEQLEYNRQNARGIRGG